eukprot:CAMPEP_0117436946 /NCGR_PEP_ID=MMETSP0759-20121206/1270_1 /TAXON_ID=63605 /ORGANISM="Percolomonas cosmopolitus, Strain WS" /LENGTH=148 /DNA_ID=CAMNT_0005228563 /DNA_START=58 /DNA_END=504 /DNA_ORIENTATION=+
MPRRSSGGSRRPSLSRRPAPKRAAPATTQKRPASTSTQNKAAAPAAAPAAGGGMMGSFIGNALSFAAGHVIGQGISRMLWPNQENVPEEQIIEREKKLVEECGDNVKAFNDCVEHYQDDISKCQFYMKELQNCREQRVDPQFTQTEHL